MAAAALHTLVDTLAQVDALVDTLTVDALVDTLTVDALVDTLAQVDRKGDRQVGR